MEKETQAKAEETIVEEFMGDRKFLKEGANELIIRHGSAKQFFYPQSVELTGIIGAPVEFFKKRVEVAKLHKIEKCHVVFDKLEGTILLICDEQNAESGFSITGKIIRNPDLDKFNINSKKMFYVKEVQDMLKFNRVYFKDKEQCNAIVTSMQKFKASVSQEIEEMNNLKGEQRALKASKIEHSLNLDFVLSMPIHKGGAKVDFNVEICLQLTSGDVTFWLESRELNDLLMATEDAMIDKEIKVFMDAGVVCIEK